MTMREFVRHCNEKVAHKAFEANQWGLRHCEAWIRPHTMERPIVGFITALADYGDAHKERFESDIGDDYVLGKDWMDILKATRGLLNGELGRLDGGTLDGMLCGLATLAGFKPEEWQ